MAAFLEGVRRYKRPLIAVEIAAALAFVLSLFASRNTAVSGYPFHLVLVFGFLVNLLWFPLCYLAWFGRPNIRPARLIQYIFFWGVAVLCTFFWVRVLLFFIRGASFGT